MAETKITCSDCGAEHVAKRRSAQRCPPCSLLAVLVYAAAKYKRTRACRACGSKHHPLRPADLALCGPCHEPHARRPIKCAFCGQERGSLDPRVGVCIVCAKSPEVRPRVIERMKASQAARRSGTSVPAKTKLPDRMSATDVVRKTQLDSSYVRETIAAAGLEHDRGRKYETSELVSLFKELAP